MSIYTGGYIPISINKICMHKKNIINVEIFSQLSTSQISPTIKIFRTLRCSVTNDKKCNDLFL